MKNLTPLFTLILFLTACNPYHYKAASHIEFKKGPCFGTCPVYTFSVNGAGDAKFHGDQNVTKQGDWVRKLTPEETNALFDVFANSNFNAFDDQYVNPQLLDLPTTWVTFVHENINKTIEDNIGAPQALKDLEALVEAIAETEEGWHQ